MKTYALAKNCLVGVTVVFCLLLGGCAHQYTSNLISVGMTKQQVTAALGVPDIEYSTYKLREPTTPLAMAGHVLLGCPVAVVGIVIATLGVFEGDTSEMMGDSFDLCVPAKTVRHRVYFKQGKVIDRSQDE